MTENRSDTNTSTGHPWQWNTPPASPVPAGDRLAHLQHCSPFAATLLQRHPEWAEGLDSYHPPDQMELQALLESRGLDQALRQYRNRCMLRIIWRDLNGLANLDETFADLGSLASMCLNVALDYHHGQLVEKHGEPCNMEGNIQSLVVIGLGKFGGGELNLSSDIDIIFCYESTGECASEGRRHLSSDQFFIRQARAVIASLSEPNEDGFCFRVDTRLRPFGDSGPLCSSLAALEQYYQREGRDWERYALIKARPVAGDLKLGQRLMQQIRPFVYRRYIDFSAVEALQEMHASVQDDARRSDRLDDIKRGPGGIREIEFLLQCFQLLRGGRELNLQTPSLLQAIAAVSDLRLMDAGSIQCVLADYSFLRQLENRIQAQHDQQTHRVPEGEDLQRLSVAMSFDTIESLQAALQAIRDSVAQRFHSIFPSRPEPEADPVWTRAWRQLQDQQAELPEKSASQADSEPSPQDYFFSSLQRLALSQRSRRRLDLFMPALLSRLDRLQPDRSALNHIFDLVLAVSRRSAYLILLVQNAAALDRLIELFARSPWVADSVIRFPALLDELIDPSLGQQIPAVEELQQSVARLLGSAPDTESALEGLNYLKLASTLRIAVAQLEQNIDATQVQAALSNLAAALLQGTLELAGSDIETRHGRISSGSSPDQNSLGIIAYGSLGSGEPGYSSDLDLVFLFNDQDPASDGDRSLSAERYYARLAQRVLGFLTAITPSGRLYEVDTRLRPNGRAGSLVSSLRAFRDYQLQEAWTWELQALTRACFVAGSQQTGEHFAEVRREVLCRERDSHQLKVDLVAMRQRMREEKGPLTLPDQLAKHGDGGLVDIEFVAQLGVLSQAGEHPEVMKSAQFRQQLQELAVVGWLSEEQAGTLAATARALHEIRLLHVLVPTESIAAIDTSPSRLICERILAVPGIAATE